MVAMNILLTGATGMVGGLALTDCLRRPEVVEVTTLGRRPTGQRDPKLVEVENDDFSDYSEVSEVFEGRDVALFCLGAYTGSVADEEFRKITVDYAVAFAEALREGSPEATFCLLSGQGADSNERSRVSFARYKGIAENAILALGFPRVHIFRPGYIFPVEPRREPSWMYRLLRRLYPALRRFSSNMGIDSDELASAMVSAGLHGTGAHISPILENRDIRRLAAQAVEGLGAP